jgi:hypothetical protein
MSLLQPLSRFPYRTRESSARSVKNYKTRVSSIFLPFSFCLTFVHPVLSLG